MAQYRQLEVSVSRRFQAAHMAGEPTPPYFTNYIERINGSLLDNIEIRAEDAVFKIYNRESNSEIRPDRISSGESELISLAIECLVFGLNLNGRPGLLLLDEPDVHLHPDLQGRLIDFVVSLVDEIGFDVVIATHSSPILAELSSRDSHICLMRPRQTDLTFEETARRAGADLRMLQKTMGHASITVTAHIYADLYDDELDVVASALDALDDRPVDKQL